MNMCCTDTGIGQLDSMVTNSWPYSHLLMFSHLSFQSLYNSMLALTNTQSPVSRALRGMLGGVLGRRDERGGEGWLVGAAEICPPAVMTDYPAGVPLILHTTVSPQPNPVQPKPYPPNPYPPSSPTHLSYEGQQAQGPKMLDSASQSVSVKYGMYSWITTYYCNTTFLKSKIHTSQQEEY